MSTATVTTTPAPSTPPPSSTPAPSAPPPAPHVDEVDSDGFTAAERAYFDSKGTKTDGLGDPAPKSTPPPQQQPQQQPQKGQAQDGDELVDGEVVIDEAGRVKDARTGRFVPHAAHHALRERFKATRTELEQTKEKFARVDERIATLNQLLQGNAQPAPGTTPAAEVDEPMPDPETDLFAHNRWLAKRVQKLESELTKSRTATEGFISETQAREVYTNDIRAYVAKQPDFLDALKILRDGRNAELAAVSDLDDKARAQQVTREERDIVQAAIRAGKSPSETLYKIAQARGYKPPSQTPPPQPGQQQQTPPAIDHAAKIEQIAAGQQRASSAFSAGGGIAGEGLTAEALLAMSEAEYDAAVAKLSAAQRRALLGG